MQLIRRYRALVDVYTKTLSLGQSTAQTEVRIVKAIYLQRTLFNYDLQIAPITVGMGVGVVRWGVDRRRVGRQLQHADDAAAARGGLWRCKYDQIDSG